MVLSVSFHLLAAWLVWFGSRETVRDCLVGQIVDTRVKEHGLEVAVCLSLLDIPQNVPMTPPEITNASDPILEKKEASDLNEACNSSFGVAGAESSKPQEKATGASKTQPRPLDAEPESGHASGTNLIGSCRDRGTANASSRLFRAETGASSVVYVIDRSTSMGLSGKLSHAKQELIESVERLSPDSRFQIILFNRSIEMFSINNGAFLLPATTENKRMLVNFLKPVLAEGGTLPLPALKRALAMKPDVIFFLSDAEALSDRDVREITRLNGGRTEIQVLALEDGEPGNNYSTLSLLAHNNRGRVRLIGDSPKPMSSPLGN
jgi:hypothetical protein